MNEKNCELCGMLIQPELKFCDTCAQMMGVENPGPSPVATFSPPKNEISLTKTFPAVQPQFETATVSDSGFNRSQSAVTASIQLNKPSNYVRPPQPNVLRQVPVNRAAEAPYKPGMLDWFWDLPAFFKIGIACIIGAILFAFALKAFMQLDVSVVSTTPTAKLESQTPWFSSWFRSTPSVEEILNKYQTETGAQGKALWAQSYKLTGEAHFLKMSAVDLPNLNDLYKNKGEFNQSRGSGSFELFLKYPNNVLLKGVTDHNQFPNVLSKNPLVTGFDGTKYWGLAKVNTDKGLMTEDIKAPSTIFYTNTLNGGISLTFAKQSFQKAELVNEEVVFDRKSYTIKGTDLLGTETSICFDIETGLLTKIAQKGLVMYVVGHQEFNGVKYPSKLVYKINNQWMLLSISAVEPDAAMDNGMFMRSAYF